MRRALLAVIALAAVAVPLAVHAQYAYGNPDYNSHFVFTRVRYGAGLGGFGFGGGFGRNAWSHDYPAGDFYLTQVLDDLTRMRVRTDRSNVLDLRDPELFQNPIIYMSEPGFWPLAPGEAEPLREYLLKGGFIIFDDFEGPAQFQNMADNMAAALPEYQWIEIGVEHPIFHIFFDVDALDVPHPSVNVTPVFLALFQDNDPGQPMLALANLNSDLAEYWEWSARDAFPVDITSGAYELGVNYVIYGLTH
jgi:hypothetical protein